LSPSPPEGERVGERGDAEGVVEERSPLSPTFSPAGGEGEKGHPSVTVELISRVERTCLADQKRARAVEVRFTPTRDGGFVGVEAQTQDPWLAACVTDVFEETPWQPSPSGTESFAPQIFSFGRPTE
jgi:hypothetical protein